jgi:methyl-accepting chemotaxis protein
LESRLDFYGLAEMDADYRSIGAFVERHAEAPLRGFYARVAATPSIAHYFPAREFADKAKRAQFNHWKTMFRHGLTGDYLARAERIGETHARIGVEPQWYIGGYAEIVGEILARMIAGGGRTILPGRAGLARRAAKFVKVAMLDMDIALSTYFARAESARNETVRRLDISLAAMADGDLTTRVSGLPAGFETLETHFNASLEQLEEAIGAVTTGTEAITTGAAEIRAASDDLAHRTEEQASNLERSANALAQINHMAHETARDVSELNQSVSKAHEAVIGGDGTVRKAISAMSDIQASAHSIARIIEMIDSIAFQTNLLALNAGVEAARVGAEGQGFAVVANEVRALAQRSAAAAEEIKTLVGQSLAHVDSGVRLVGEAGTALQGVLGQIGDIRNAADRIASSASSQSDNLAAIHLSVTDMDRVTQQNAAMVEQSNAAARAMDGEVSQLARLVNKFRCGLRSQPEADRANRAAA